MTTSENVSGQPELELIAPVQGGQMLARLSGQVVFVHGGIPGEIVAVDEPVRKRGYLEADAISVVREAPVRDIPPCPYFGENGRHRGSIAVGQDVGGLVCGGCRYQHIAYATQLEIKQRIVADQLRRVGKILDAPVLSAEPSPAPYNYRNKASWLVTEEGELAYHEARSHRAVAIAECHILTPGVLRVFDAIRGASAELGLGGILRGLEARSLPTSSGEEAATLVLTLAPSISLDEATVLAEALQDVCPTVKSVSAIGTDRYAQPVHLAGVERIRVAFLEELLSLSPTTFFQVNLAVAEALVRYTFAQLGPVEGRQVLDVYSGAGTFTVPLARQADAVIGVEVDEGSVADTRDTLARMGLENVTLLHGDAASGLKSLLPGSVSGAIIDPPRTGCSPEVLRQLARIRAPRLVYVSCDPATLARDLRFLLDHGYQLEAVQPFDLFPQTAHIESATTLKLPRKFQARR
ncbi:MAG: rumA [Chloroflexi bacterium]|nr:rumA [Chloroflexota bacterium]